MLDARKNIDLIKDIDEISEKGIQAFGLLYDESGCRYPRIHDKNQDFESHSCCA